MAQPLTHWCIRVRAQVKQMSRMDEFFVNSVYVIEFFASWCGPCRSSVPHVGTIHERVKNLGVFVIGVTSLDSRQNVGAVKRFCSKMEQHMTYVPLCNGGDPPLL